jgi:hypothetical protein
MRIRAACLPARMTPTTVVEPPISIPVPTTGASCQRGKGMES